MISSYDQLVAAIAGANSQPVYKASMTAEAAGVFHSYWTAAGRPAAGNAPSVGLAGEVVDNNFAGVIPYANAQAGKKKMLAGLSLSSTTAGVMFLYDRLWQNSTINVTTTTLQSWTAVAAPSRDENGQNLGANVEAFLEVYTATTNASPVTGATISYTNSAGVAGRTGTIQSINATAVAGTMIAITLQAGDTGVKSIEGITLGTSLVSGSVGLVLVRRLAEIPIPNANSGDYRNFFDIGRSLYDGTALALLALVSGTTAGVVAGNVQLIEG
jgi:hypothetical protein